MDLVLLVDEEHSRVVAAEQMLATVQNLVEYRLRISHRPADDLEHLGRGGLLFERFPGFIEQSHVLDRDHGLAGECLQQLDFLAAKDPTAARLTVIAPTTCSSRSIGTDRPLRYPAVRTTP